MTGFMGARACPLSATSLRWAISLRGMCRPLFSAVEEVGEMLRALALAMPAWTGLA